VEAQSTGDDGASLAKNLLRNATVSEYLQDFKLELGEGGSDSNPAYFFKNSDSSFKELKQDLAAVTYFANRTAFPWTDKKRQKRALFLFGPAHSSTFFHAHTNAYRALLYGSTRWFVYPPTMDNARIDGDHTKAALSMVDWLEKHFDKRSGQWRHLQTDGGGGGTAAGALPVGWKPVECVQRAGEVAFIPTGWKHGIVNLQNSIGMAIEVGDAMEKEYNSAVACNFDAIFMCERIAIPDEGPPKGPPPDFVPGMMKYARKAVEEEPRT
jgi:hypothetical protein